MHYLICDINIKQQGHYIGYNQYILDNIHRLTGGELRRTYSFLYNEEAQTLLRFPENIKGRVHFLNDNGLNNPTAKSKVLLFKKIVSFAEENKIDHLLFMDLDQYQLPIFLTKCTFRISGILFRPHHRIIASNSGLSSWIMSKMQRYKKIIAEKFLTQSKEVQNIFILNDEAGVNLLNKVHKCHKFQYLPDPVFSYSSLKPAIKKNNLYKFLIFGAINERKNITAILKAYDDAHFTIDTELTIVGPTQEDYLNYVHNLLKDLKTINTKKAVFVKAGFVTNEEMDIQFYECDICLLIYKDFYGSSGLLGRAALHQKKVIGANVGLLKELIDQNGLGITCDPNSIKEISKSMMAIQNIDIDPASFESFYRKYSPDTFIVTLLNYPL